MTKRKTKTIKEIGAEFRRKMQAMVDDPKSGITEVSISSGKTTVVLASKQPVSAETDNGETA